MSYDIAHPASRAANPRYGMGNTYNLAEHPSLEFDGHNLGDRLRERFSRPDYDPPKLPSVALDLMRLSRNPEATNRDIIALVEKDQLLAGRVLKIGNSSAYRGTRQILSLNDAVVRLGRRALADLVMQIAMTMRVFRCKPYSAPMEKLRRHSLATAHVCRHLARQTSLASEFAFLCGLLHDAGLAAIFIELAETRRPEPPPALSDIWLPVESIHEEVTANLCQSWQLPDEIVRVVACHHHPVQHGLPHPMACVVALADAIVNLLGYDLGIGRNDGVFAGVDKTTPEQLDLAQRALGFGPARMKKLAEGAKELLDIKLGGE